MGSNGEEKERNWTNSMYEYTFCGVFDWIRDFFHLGDCYVGNGDEPKWIWGTFNMMAREFITVLIQIVCYERVQLNDMFTGSLILYMMLVTFAFPFMSSYLFVALRLGPWYPKDKGLGGLGRVVIQIILVVGAQLSGAAAAWQLMNLNLWKGSGMQLTSNEVWNNGTVIEPSHLRENGTKIVSTSTVTWNFVGVDNTISDKRLPGLEECMYTVFFLVGLLHLMDADAGDFMLNAHFNGDEKRQAASTVNADNAKGTTGKESESVNQNEPKQTNEAMARNSIPITFILHVCILLAAVTRAFPTAHGTPAITLYLLWSGIQSDSSVINSRIIGGSFGSLLVLFYYHFVYVWRQPKGIIKGYIDNVIKPRPPFLYSELRLPHSMRNGDKTV